MNDVAEKLKSAEIMNVEEWGYNTNELTMNFV
jgi:hypothetical protein